MKRYFIDGKEVTAEDAARAIFNNQKIMESGNIADYENIKYIVVVGGVE